MPFSFYVALVCVITFGTVISFRYLPTRSIATQAALLALLFGVAVFSWL
jgi:hypothetical protein